MSGTRLLFVAIALTCSTAAARGSTITYYLTIGTSSVAGDAGYLDYQFNPGVVNVNPVAAATAQLRAFGSDGALDLSNVLINGDASGSLPGTVSLDNGTPLNEYSPNFTYASIVTFDVTLTWTQPATQPDAGTVFAFYMSQDLAGTNVAGSSSPDGRLLDLNINPDGTSSADDYSIGSEAVLTISTTAPATGVPEPGSLLLVAGGIWAVWRQRIWRSPAHDGYRGGGVPRGQAGRQALRRLRQQGHWGRV